MAKAYYDICPCKDCKERKVGCHENCVAYKEWKRNSVEVIEPYFDRKKKRRRK